jgi:hypothetical protein
MEHTHSAIPGPHRPLDLTTIINRVTGTITFRRRTIMSIAADRRATLEAGIIIALVGVTTAIGHRTDVAVAITAALMGWLGLAVTVWYITNRFMYPPASHVDVEPILRAVGFASAPAALGIVHFIWVLGPFLGGIGTLWSFAATAFVVRHTTRLGWLRTLAITIGAGIIVNVVGIVVSLITGIYPQIW